MGSDWKFTWFESWEIVLSPEFISQWEKWFGIAQMSHVFYHPQIALAWIKTYREIREISPFFCKAECNGNLFFIPLILWRKNWKNAFQRQLEPLGASDYDYHDPIWIGGNTSIDFGLFWDAFIHEIKIKFHKKADSIVLPGMRHSGNGLGWKEEDTICIYNDLTASSTEQLMLQSLNASLRGDIRRQIRRLEEQGALSFYKHNDIKDQITKQNFELFLQLHTERWPNAYKAPDFHANLLKNGLAEGLVDFTELRLNEIPISWHLGFLWQNHYYYYMPVIAPAFARYSPGKIHLYYLLKECISKGMTVFDHLKGQEDYKGQWSNNYAHIYSFSQYSLHFQSRLRNHLATRVRSGISKILKAEQISNIKFKKNENETSSQRNVRVQCITDWSDIQSHEFQTKWLDFYKQNTDNHVFFHPSLSMAWIETYLKLRDIKPLFYLLSWDEKEVLMPLVFWKKNWKHLRQKAIKPIGHNDFDYADPLTNSSLTASEWNKVWGLILNDIKQTQKYDKIAIRNIHQECSGNDYSWSAEEFCPFIDLKAFSTLSDFFNSLPGKQAKELRRRYRRLNEIGKVELHHFTATEVQEALGELTQMLQAHSMHWPKAYKAPGLHSNLVKKGLEAGTLHFSVLKLDGNTISWRIGFMQGKRYYSYMPAYLQLYANYSPGKLHQIECIGYAIEHGCHVFDMLRGNEAYKSEWASGEWPVGSIRTERNNNLRKGINSIPSK